MPKGWKELDIGGIVNAGGTSIEYDTGSWRTFRPVFDFKKCTHCLLCWIYCPDSSIKVEGGKIKEVDLQHCKGCGICAYECPPKVKAITMVKETEIPK